MEKTEEKQVLYSVIILRTDGEHLIVLESSDYDKCFEKWNHLQNLWQQVGTENKPFVLNEPLVTAFHPMLIKEITLRPVIKDSVSTKYENPYSRKMVEKGFSETFNRFASSGIDLLDDGYK